MSATATQSLPSPADLSKVRARLRFYLSSADPDLLAVALRLVAIEEAWRERGVDRVHVRWRGFKGELSTVRARLAAERLLALGMLRGEVAKRGLFHRPVWLIFAWLPPSAWQPGPRDPWVAPRPGDAGTRILTADDGSERPVRRQVLEVSKDTVTYSIGSDVSSTTTERWLKWGRRCSKWEVSDAGL